MRASSAVVALRNCVWQLATLLLLLLLLLQSTNCRAPSDDSLLVAKVAVNNNSNSNNKTTHRQTKAQTQLQTQSGNDNDNDNDDFALLTLLEQQQQQQQLLNSKRGAISKGKLFASELDNENNGSKFEQQNNDNTNTNENENEKQTTNNSTVEDFINIKDVEDDHAEKDIADSHINNNNNKQQRAFINNENIKKSFHKRQTKRTKANSKQQEQPSAEFVVDWDDTKLSTNDNQDDDTNSALFVRRQNTSDNSNNNNNNDNDDDNDSDNHNDNENDDNISIDSIDDDVVVDDDDDSNNNNNNNDDDDDDDDATTASSINNSNNFQRLKTNLSSNSSLKPKISILSRNSLHNAQSSSSSSSLRQASKMMTTLDKSATPILSEHYVGRVLESERLVLLHPKLRVLNGEVCDLELTNNNNNNVAMQKAEIPFEVSWIDRVTGEATLELRRDAQLDCEQRQTFEFTLTAVGCNGRKSNNASVVVHVDDVNEFSPEFEHLHYALVVDEFGTVLLASAGATPPPPLELAAWLSGEGALQPPHPPFASASDAPLMQVRAVDADCSLAFSKVCRYELLPDVSDSPQSPLVNIDESGQVRLVTQPPLLLSMSRNLTSAAAAASQQPLVEQWTFQVLAYDCAGKKSHAPARLSFAVARACRPSLKGVDSSQVQKRATTTNNTSNASSVSAANSSKAATASSQATAALSAASSNINDKDAAADVDGDATQLQSAFPRAHFELCGLKCARRNISVAVSLQVRSLTAASSKQLARVNENADHDLKSDDDDDDSTLTNAAANGDEYLDAAFNGAQCDRELASLVARRKQCGARVKALELLPPFATLTNIESNSNNINAKQKQKQQYYKQRATSTDNNYNRNNDNANGNNSANDNVDKDDADDDLLALESSPPQLTSSSSSSASVASLRQALLLRKSKQRFVAVASKRRQKLRKRRPARQTTITTTTTSNNNSNDVVTEERQKTQSAAYSDSVRHFDGLTSALAVPRAHLESFARQLHDELPHFRWLPFVFGARHSLNFWLKLTSLQQPQKLQQQQQTVRKGKLKREFIVCASESSGKTARIAYALFVDAHTCQLVLHMRRLSTVTTIATTAAAATATQSTLPLLQSNINQQSLFSHSKQSTQTDLSQSDEWKWKLRDNCSSDAAWRLYSLSVSFPSVQLHVDGELIDESFERPLANSPNVQQQHQQQQQLHQQSLLVNSSTIDNLIAGDELLDEPAASWTVKGASDSDASLVLSVGGCFDARTQQINEQLSGSLGGLLVTLNSVDEPTIAECTGKCSESLASTSAQTSSSTTQSMNDEQQPQRQRQRARIDNSLVAFQSSASKIELVGHDWFDVQDALTDIAYVTTRSLPSAAKRKIRVDVNFDCWQQQQQQQAGNSTSGLSESQAMQTQFSGRLPPAFADVVARKQLVRANAILISGVQSISRNYEQLAKGTRLFSTLNMRIVFRSATSSGTRNSRFSRTDADAETLSDYIDDSTTNLHADNDASLLRQLNTQQQQQQSKQTANSLLIESCAILVQPKLNSLHESLQLPVSLMRDLHLYWRESNTGALIYGLESAFNYKKLMRAIVYANTRPAIYTERAFSVQCGAQNARIVSNKYAQVISVLHTLTTTATTTSNNNINKNNNKLLFASKKFQNFQNHFDQLNETNYGSNLRSSQLELPQQHFTRIRETPISSIEPSTTTTTTTQNSMSKLSSSQLKTAQLAQRQQLDRLIVAFLVFVVSVIVIVVIVALVNLKAISSSSSSSSSRQRKRRMQRQQQQRRRRRLVKRSSSTEESDNLEIDDDYCNNNDDNNGDDVDDNDEDDDNDDDDDDEDDDVEDDDNYDINNSKSGVAIVENPLDASSEFARKRKPKLLLASLRVNTSGDVALNKRKSIALPADCNDAWSKWVLRERQPMMKPKADTMLLLDDEFTCAHSLDGFESCEHCAHCNERGDEEDDDDDDEYVENVVVVGNNRRTIFDNLVNKRNNNNIKTFNDCIECDNNNNNNHDDNDDDYDVDDDDDDGWPPQCTCERRLNNSN